MQITRNLAIAAAIIPFASAFFRMPCPSRLIQERIDPIMAPGQISAHMHTVAGGNGFGFTTSFKQQRDSTCSSCPIKEDLSAYWTPKLYFQAENGSFIGVPQVGDYNGLQGGMTVYYLQRPGPDNDKLLAFPEGFRMIAGDPFKRNYTGDFPAQAISFACLDFDAEASPETKHLPKRNCPNGVRAQVFFPSCWNGKDLDTADHKSHMSYPKDTAHDNGRCPASHPKHMISLFFEVIYDTNHFASMWPSADKMGRSGQPFVFAQGDPTGYGFHGDFVNGWDVAKLQHATDNCNSNSGRIEDCPTFKNDFFTPEQNHACKVPVVLGTNVDGPMKLLPGCNVVSQGPERVVPPISCSRIPPVGVRSSFTDVTSKGWKYLGCAGDDYYTRSFTGASTNQANMTVEGCVAFCKGKGFSLAGAEYGTE